MTTFACAPLACTAPSAAGTTPHVDEPDASPDVAPPPPDAGDSITISANPNSVLSVLVSFELTGATAARVISSAGTEQLSSPSLSLDQTGSGQIAVLGLSAGTEYKHVLEKTTGTGPLLVDTSDAISTGTLPPELGALSFTVTRGSGAPQAGYYLVCGAGPDTFAVDPSGAVRWYRAFGESSAEAKMQPDGTFTSFVGTSTGSEIAAGEYVRYTGDGTQIATYAAPSPEATEPGSPVVYTDPHELLVTTDEDGSEHVHFLSYIQRPNSATDPTLSAWHELLREGADGTIELRYKIWPRFSIADQIEKDRGPTDMDHANGLAIDPTDENYVLSLRNFDALVKLDYDSGEVIWQLGGKQSDFTIMGDPLGGFHGQHSPRVLASGNILLYDNGLGHSPPESRAVEYAIDPVAKTAKLVWQYRHSPPIFTEFVGSVERLGNGNTLVAFGAAGIVDEVDPQGNVVWEGKLQNGAKPQLAYRIRRLPNLYTFTTP
jgi:hypothetical protein